MVVAAATLVDMNAAGLDPAQLLHLGDNRPQSVAVIGIAVQRFSVQHKLAAPGLRRGWLLGLVAGVAIDTLQPNS